MEFIISMIVIFLIYFIFKAYMFTKLPTVKKTTWRDITKKEEESKDGNRPN